ncbi:MAG: hypothetical protein NZ108_07255, partial [Bacteroidia bacterium]|nr:hypothetical protein [Bacteroidia bacterium]
GTARAVGMGGAFSAVGADFTSATLNPAGLGLCRKSDLMFTPAFKVASTETKFLDAGGTGSRTNFGFTNIGFILNSSITEGGRKKDKGLKSWSLAIGYNQLEHYNNRIEATGFNTANSITDFFEGQARGQNAQNLDPESYAGLGFNCYFIDTISGSTTQYFPAVIGGKMEQTYSRIERGRSNSWEVSFAGNINDQIYIGAGLGIVDVKYFNELSITEFDKFNVYNSISADTTPVNNLSFYDKYSTSGTGINGKFGVIIQPADFIRVGLGVQTPTLISLTDRYSTELSLTLDNGFVFGSGGSTITNSSQQEGIFDYRLTTPYRVTAGVMGIIGKKAIVSLDADVIDYRTARLSPANNALGSYNFRQENDNIQKLFGMGYNIRAGGEVRFDEFYVRAGFGMFTSVINQENQSYQTVSGQKQSISGFKQVITGGLGYRAKGFYIDLAYVYQSSENKFIAYSVPTTPNLYTPTRNMGSSPIVVPNRILSTAMLTFGFKF